MDATRRFANFLNPPEHAPLIKVASGPTGNLLEYEVFTRTLLANAKGLDGAFNFQALSLHYYTWPIADNNALALADDKGPIGPKITAATGFGEDKWAAYLRAALAIETVITNVSSIMDADDPGRQIALYVDEWGAWHEQGSDFSQQNTLLDAEIAALTFNVFHRHTARVKMANVSLMVNAGQSLILTQKDKMVLTPTYFVYDLYQPFRNAEPLTVSVTAPTYDFGGHSLPAVDVSAARRANGRIILAIVNLDPNRRADIKTNLSGHAQGSILTGPSIDSHNSFERPGVIRPAPCSGREEGGFLTLHLPAKSVAVVEVD